MKYLVTDPCYILSNDDWREVCDIADKAGDWTEAFNNACADKLREVSGDKRADACGTGYGDWSNRLFGMSGRATILCNDFYADSGMVCVVEVTDQLEKYLANNDHDMESLAAVVESDEPLEGVFDCENTSWTVVRLVTVNGHNPVAESEPYEEDDEEEE